MGHSASQPRFEDWLRDLIHYETRDARGESLIEGDGPNDELIECKHRIDQIGVIQQTAFLSQLFESPAVLSTRCTTEELAWLIHALLDDGSGYVHGVRDPRVPTALQVRWIRSIAPLYTDLFDSVCHDNGPVSNPRGGPTINGVVFMIWDLGLHYVFRLPEFSHLAEPAIDVLQTILTRCTRIACQESALHGIGHGIQSSWHHSARIPCLKMLVDEFLQRNDLADSVRAYALQAREGAVQ